MRVAIFWIMCHLSLGHEKKALLSASYNLMKYKTKQGAKNNYKAKLHLWLLSLLWSTPFYSEKKKDRKYFKLFVS